MSWAEILTFTVMALGSIGIPLFVWNSQRSASRLREEREDRARRDAEERAERAAQFAKIEAALGQIQGVLIEVAKVRTEGDEVRANVSELKHDTRDLRSQVDRHSVRLDTIERMIA